MNLEAPHLAQLPLSFVPMANVVLFAIFQMNMKKAEGLMEGKLEEKFNCDSDQLLEELSKNIFCVFLKYTQVESKASWKKTLNKVKQNFEKQKDDIHKTFSKLGKHVEIMYKKLERKNSRHLANHAESN